MERKPDLLIAETFSRYRTEPVAEQLTGHARYLMRRVLHQFEERGTWRRYSASCRSRRGFWRTGGGQRRIIQHGYAHEKA